MWIGSSHSEAGMGRLLFCKLVSNRSDINVGSSSLISNHDVKFVITAVIHCRTHSSVSVVGRGQFFLRHVQFRLSYLLLPLHLLDSDLTTIVKLTFKS